jgi:mannose-6-phosphate isomerase-like protein (cupin superfamily)
MNTHVKTFPAEEDLWFLNGWMTILRPSASGRDGVSIMEFHIPYGDSPPTHIHHDEDEVFHLLEGRMRFRVGDKEFVLEPGHTVVAPKGVPHCFKVESREGARGLNIAPGPHFEGFVRAVSRPAEGKKLPPHGGPTAEMAAKLADVAARFNIAIIGPPMV